MFRWGFLVALTGCAQLAGIDDTSKPPDTQPSFASLRVERVHIGTTIVTGPQDLTANTASFLVPDDTAPGGQRRVPATLAGLDTWQADVGDMPVPIQFDSPELPNPVARIFDLPNLTLTAAVPVLEHPQPAPAPENATFNINVGLNTAHGVEGYQMFTVGAWSAVNLPQPVAGATSLTTAVMLAPTNSPIRRLDRITTSDTVVLLRYSGNQLVAHFEVPPFDQDVTTNITGAYSATPADQALDIRVEQTRSAQRLSTVRPAVNAPSYVWRLRASPGLDYFVENGPQLNASGVAAPTTADPQTITAPYGNPFAAKFRTLLQWDVTSTRTYTNPTTGETATLAARLSERAEPSAGLVVATPAGLPDRITANGTVLNVDNLTVVAPANAPVEVSFVTDAASNTGHHVQLLELVPNMMGGYTLTNVVVATMLAPQTRIPRDLFKDGALYALRAFSFQGCTPAIASGDLTQLALPCSITFADSGVFQVATP